MANLNGKEQLNLKKMINESEAEDYTDYIREVKHSVLIRDDIRKIDTLKILIANSSLPITMSSLHYA